MAASDVAQTAGIQGAESRYVVLRKEGDMRDDGWKVVHAMLPAPNADAAIRKAAGDVEGEYVAVPSRSWAPRKLTVKTEKRVSLS